jgi:hypothetical protein
VPIGLAVGGILLLLALCLGLVGVVVYQVGVFGRRIARDVDQAVKQAAEAMEPIAVIMQFHQNVSTGQTAAAYALTTDGFQEKKTLQQFQEMMAGHPELARSGLALTDQGEQTPTSCTLRATVATANGRQVPITLRLVKEKGRWKVDDVAFP